MLTPDNLKRSTVTYQAGCGDVRDLFAATRRLLVDADSLVYTDGSVVRVDPHKRTRDDRAAGTPEAPGASERTVAGAGVYKPAPMQSPHGPSPGRSTGTSYAIDPVAEGDAAASVNRAEAAAVWYALSHRLGPNIATDSATVLYQIRNALLRPGKLAHNSNRLVIQAIVDAIDSSNEHVHLYKVKAHTGIPGNEYADAAARQAVTRLTEGDRSLPCCPVANENPTASLLWPHHHVTGRSTQPVGQAGVPVKDLSQHLVQAVHESSRLGYSDTQGVYYKSWSSITAEADGKRSNTITTASTAHEARRRRMVLQYRTGGLHTAKLRHRMQLVRTPDCVLCGQLDGGHHALSGCSHLKGLYIERHNAAGRLILRYVTKGSKGGNVVAHDFGKQKTPQLDPDCLSLPRTVPGQGRRGSRPDLVMISAGRHTPLSRRRVDILELKYCRDTDPSAQLARAGEQHTRFVERLLRKGYRGSRIHYHTIALGVSGTIYKSMYPVLGALGVEKATAQRLASKLHKLAAHFTEIIMQTKWNQERLARRHKITKAGIG